MKKSAISILLTTALSAVVLNAKEIDCLSLTQAVAIEVSADKARVLEIVSGHMAATPGCACEIVKSAIKASEGDAQTVAAIVEAAISEAPEQVRLISQCAIAVAPDAIGAIQALLATLDPNSGDSVNSSKNAKAAAMTDDEVAGVDWNPLDFPGENLSAVPNPNFPFGPGSLRMPPGLALVPPRIIIPPFVTDPNP